MSSLCLMLIKSSWLNSGLELAFLTEEDSKYHYIQEDHYMNYSSYQKQQMIVILWDHRKSQWLFMLWKKKGCRKFMRT